MKSDKYMMTCVMLAIFVVMVGVALQYPGESRFMPLLVGIPAIALCLLQLFLDFRASRQAADGTPADTRGGFEETPQGTSRITGREVNLDVPRENSPATTPSVDPAELRRRELIVWGYFLGLVGGILVFGFLLTLPTFIVAFLRHWAQTSWRFALGLAATASVALYMIFVEGLKVNLHPGFATQYVLERLTG